MSSAPQARRQVRPGIWVLLIAVATGLLLLMPRRAAPPGENPAPSTEVERSLLTFNESRVRQNGKPFTGFMIEHYPDGALKSRSAISNGVLHGVSEGWHTNRVLQVREHFELGISHGQRLRWDEQGHKVSEAQIVKGKIEGVFRRWHDNGVLAEEVAMKNGEPDGPSSAYYASGCLKTFVRMQNGKAIFRKSWPDGEINSPDIVALLKQSSE